MDAIDAVCRKTRTTAMQCTELFTESWLPSPKLDQEFKRWEEAPRQNANGVIRVMAHPLTTNLLIGHLPSGRISGILFSRCES